MPLTSYILLAFFCLSSCVAETQPQREYINLQKVATLPKSLNETSGIAHGDDHSFYVHNDSGNKPRLYKISNTTGEIQKEIKVIETKNHDWEELAEDSARIFIGDFGNNTGMRKNLKIYQVLKKDLLEKDEVNAEVIAFDYPDRTTPTGRKHNYDCESMVLIGDSLYLFSKNRADLATDVYRLPTVPGKYIAEHVGHFNTGGLITSADFRPGKTNTLVLLGYEMHGDRYQSFLWVFSGFQGTDFFSGRHIRREISPDLQAEAILFDSDTSVLITNEEEKGGLGNMNRIVINELIN